MTANLTVPERRVVMNDGQTVLLRGDHRAWYTLERHTGKPLGEFLAQFAAEQGVAEVRSLAPIYDLAWALSATDRDREGRSETFEQFLERIPGGYAMQGFMGPLMEIVSESFSPAGDSGNANQPQGRRKK